MERLRGRLRERSAAVALALAIELLLVLLLIFMAPVMPGKEKGAIPAVFSVDSGDSDEAQETTPQKAARQQTKSGRAQPTPPKPVEPPPPPFQPPPPVPLPPSFLKLTREQYRAADITGRGTAPQPADSAGAQVASAAGGGGMAGDSAVVGKAPNGEPLYRAEWYRRPTNAELQPYISPRARGPGYGVVACRMVPSYRVEDCQVIGEGPGGYAYGRAVQQAAWQFRVRPPRIGGKEQYGTWVSIRITYGDMPAGEDE